MRAITELAELGRGVSRYYAVIGPAGSAEKVEKQGYIKMLSASNGTAILIGDTLIDCGCSWVAVEPYVRQIHSICLTHSHTDHVNKATLQRLIQHRIPVYALQETIDELGILGITPINPEEKITTNQHIIKAIKGEHTVPVLLYIIYNVKTHTSIAVITDTVINPAMLPPQAEGKIDILIGEYRYIRSRVEILKFLSPEGACKLREYHKIQNPSTDPITDDDFKCLIGHAAKEDMIATWNHIKKPNGIMIRLGNSNSMYSD